MKLIKLCVAIAIAIVFAYLILNIVPAQYVIHDRILFMSQDIKCNYNIYCQSFLLSRHQKIPPFRDQKERLQF